MRGVSADTGPSPLVLRMGNKMPPGQASFNVDKKKKSKIRL